MGAIVSLVPRNPAVALDNKVVAGKLREAADAIECGRDIVASVVLLVNVTNSPVAIQVYGKWMTTEEAAGILAFAQFRLASGFIP